jgi:hypothetical protein
MLKSHNEIFFENQELYQIIDSLEETEREFTQISIDLNNKL